MDYIECAADTDCVAEDTSCGYSGHVKKTVCLCTNTLLPAKADGTCTEGSIHPKGDDVFNISRFIIDDSPSSFDLPTAERNSPILPNSSRTTNKENKTSSTIPLDDQIIPNDYTLMRIFIPLSSIIIVLFICVIVYRRWKPCKRKKVRKEAVIKSSEDVQLLDRMNFVNKNPSYFLSTRAGVNARKIFVNEIPFEKVKVLDVVGEGAFGQVFKGNYMATDDSTKSLVAVKVLKEGVSNEVREDFQREVEIMSAFDHDNILKLIGVITRGVEETPYMVFEYMLHGDLAEMLRRNDPAMRKNGHEILLQKTDLIDIATQISNGMTYLTSQHFVHRDLATRNCLVGEDLIVKISDFGMARDVYTCDYYRIGGSRMLPIRWMSPESVKYGRFTTESDIWAYGVVLWEIFSYGRQPYYGHSNEEVVRFLDEGILLQRPDECPSTVYHLMLGCWKTSPKERLVFSRIYNHLVDYNKQVVRNTHNMQAIDIDSESELGT